MEKFGRAQPVRRFEDQRFLRGEGRYIDDTAPDGALTAVFYRAPVAHGRIVSLDLDEARAVDGVVAVWGASDLDAGLADPYLDAALVPGGKETERPILARDKVRFVGEPVALIVAETKAAAEEALELILPEIDELPVKLDLAPGGEAVHDSAPDNVAFRYTLGDPDGVAKAFEAAAHRVKTTVVDNKIICNSMEPRGAWAEWDGERLHLSISGQGVWGTKDDIVKHLGLSPDQVRVTTPDVGGGFGMKGQRYPEEYAIAAAAKMIGRPVHWMSGRTEAMLSDNMGRALVSETELAFDADHRILAYRVETLSDLGSTNSQFGQMIQSNLFARVMTGVYDMPAASLDVRGIFTNTCQVDAYRGAGRPEAIFALERSMGNAARVMGVDPVELRRKNFIRPDAFPYTTVADEHYDVGEFARVLDRAGDFADMAGFEGRRSESEAKGLVRGIGLSYYIEAILGSPEETARVEFHEDGTASIYVGTQSNGQGHETVYAQFLSDQSGIPVEAIRVVQGDSDLIAQGGGTGGSRSVTTQSNATLSTVAKIVEGFGAFLADHLEAEGEVTFDDERFRVPGSNVSPTMLEAAQMAREAGRDDLLTVEATATLPGRSYPNGCHVAEVEIDPATGVVTVDRYHVADDFGNLINPLLAEGQVHGGVAQGIGQAIREHVVYDGTGQLLTATFMDYAMPRAHDLPMIGFVSEPVPSKNNPLGMKGCGEAGTVGALAAVANAVHDALMPLGVERVDMPFTPHRVWEAIRAAAPERLAAE